MMPKAYLLEEEWDWWASFRLLSPVLCCRAYQSYSNELGERAAIEQEVKPRRFEMLAQCLRLPGRAVLSLLCFMTLSE